MKTNTNFTDTKNPSTFPVNLERLRGKFTALEPLTSAHAPELFEAARDPNIWTYLPSPRPETVSAMAEFIASALHKAANGEEIPFVIRDQKTKAIVGSTRYLELRPAHRALEIGWTWITPAFQRTITNTEVKYLLLQHAFEEMGCQRVQLKTDWRNDRSQAAIERIGATREGMLRKHLILPDGVTRDTVFFSIIDSEWKTVKSRLQSFLADSVREMFRPQVTKIELYPIKSLDALSVKVAEIGPGGGFRFDREWRIVDTESDKVIHGKNTVLLHRIAAHFALDRNALALELKVRPLAPGIDPKLVPEPRGDPGIWRGRLPGAEDSAAAWLSRVLGFKVRLEHSAHGFPDDTEAAGPTLLSTATLRALSTKLNLPIADLRARFRTNIEVDAPELPAFWEDALFAAPPNAPRFGIGEIVFSGSNPCQRCVVPQRDPLSGARYPSFSKTLSDFRRATLPAWAATERFDHFYRIAVNTKVDGPSQVGQKVAIGEPFVPFLF
jgi:uncharacterized protein YcbX/RimJ/RimL family protein N-acetyltransferase